MENVVRRHELIVIGAGSAGYAAARTARDVGCDVALVDTGPLGGLCILRGCMPSKALLASSDALADARDAAALGIHVKAVSIDVPFIAARKRALVKDFADYRIAGIEQFALYHGAARFSVSPTEILVGEVTTLEAPNSSSRHGKRHPPDRAAGPVRNRLRRQRRSGLTRGDPGI